tara:strand:- start:3644 stop:4264 length:621 start_codon:yes stop_codon:yes gene_type:complete
MESYCVSYPTSLGGDFTIWFINKHFGVEQKGFVGFDDMYVFKSPHIFRNYFEDSFVDENFPKQFPKKFAYKISFGYKGFGHSCILPIKRERKVDDEIKRVEEDFPNTRFIFLTCSDVNSNLAKMYIQRRFMLDKIATESEYKTMMEMYNERVNYKNGFPLCLDKLLSKDEMHYNELLDFINEQPIDNWKEDMNYYNNEIVKKYDLL